MLKKHTILYIDGENFLFKAAEVLKNEKLISHKSEITSFSFSNLAKSALTDFMIAEKRFYAAKVNLYKETPAIEEKSKVIIESQRRLKRNLTNDRTSFILSGNVRLQETVPATVKRPAKYIFKEKGTDVQLAIDALAGICDGAIDTILLLSSDSDMQPLVREARKRKCKIVYVGFERNPNVGLSNNCDQTILLRKKEIVDAYNASKAN